MKSVEENGGVKYKPEFFHTPDVNEKKMHQDLSPWCIFCVQNMKILLSLPQIASAVARLGACQAHWLRL